MQPKTHPVIAAFDNLLMLRAHNQSFKDDIVAKFVGFCAANMHSSYSQLFQDLFVLFFLNSKRNGTFVEFGATNGLDLSNTALLERSYAWTGILAEPARCWHESLKSNRRAKIDTRCVWSASGHNLEFTEPPRGDLSTLTQLKERDHKREERRNGKVYSVETISLNDLLKQHDCPKTIDYLSIDTEGSEYEILRSFDFSAYEIGVITVEHNFIEVDRGNIQNILNANGFVRVFEFLSKWDDWYVRRSLLSA